MKKKNIQFNSDSVFHLVVIILSAFAFFITLYPFLYVFAVSFSSARAAYAGEVFVWPVEFTLAGYKEVFKQSNLWRYYGNTIFYTVAGTAANILVTCLLAFPLSRPTFSGRKFINFFIAFTMYFSGGLIPCYLINTQLGFFNNRLVMILPSLLSTYNVMICRSAFSGIPADLIESAHIDGASDITVFSKIAVRLITPTLAVLTLYYAVGHWNDFFTSLLYFSKEELMPIQMLLRRVLLQASQEMNTSSGSQFADVRNAATLQIRYVTIIVSTLPILTVYPFLQKYFVKGIMLGAVKG